MIRKIAMATLIAVSSFAMGGPSLVESTKIIKGEVNPLQEFVGTLNFKRNSVLAAQESGRIKSIKIEVGDKVKKAEHLVQIDVDLLNAQIQTARANAQIAKKDFDRYTKLLESKSISQKEFDDARVNHVRASSTLKELQIRKNRRTIKAPFDGIVVSKDVSLGEWVNTGSKVATVVNTKDAELTFNVPLNFVKGLKKGDIYDVTVGENIIKAKMLGTIPNGDSMTRTFPVKFKADTNKIFVFDGQEAKVKLSQNGKQEALILPRDAVIKRFGQNVIFAINDKNLSVMIPVQVIGFVEKNIAIMGEKLVEGMQIITKGNERVFPNSPVKVINQAKN